MADMWLLSEAEATSQLVEAKTIYTKHFYQQWNAILYMWIWIPFLCP